MTGTPNQQGQTKQGNDVQMQQFVNKYLKSNPEISDKIFKTIPESSGISNSDFQKWLSNSH